MKRHVRIINAVFFDAGPETLVRVPCHKVTRLFCANHRALLAKRDIEITHAVFLVVSCETLTRVL